MGGGRMFGHGLLAALRAARTAQRAFPTVRRLRLADDWDFITMFAFHGMFFFHGFPEPMDGLIKFEECRDL